MKRRSVAITFCFLLSLLCLAAPLRAGLPAYSRATPAVERTEVVVAGRAIAVNAVRIPPDAFRIKVGLAQGRVGATEPLASIAGSHRAVAAINGCFFNAYTHSAIKAPYNHIITEGQLVHVGNRGVTLGFTGRGSGPDGGYRMERLRFQVRGGLDGRWVHPHNWYAYFVNHPVVTSSAATIYTSYWVGGRTPNLGMQVVVRRGIVQTVGRGSHVIPDDGYVLVLSGREQYLAGRFWPGRRADYRLVTEAPGKTFWGQAQEALGCGPRLVEAGSIRVGPVGEGFSHPKIRSMSGARSAVGVTRDGELLLASTSGATIHEMAQVMHALGGHDAMNLDGGASSGLWVGGRYLTTPGRNISHALLVVEGD